MNRGRHSTVGKLHRPPSIKRRAVRCLCHKQSISRVNEIRSPRPQSAVVEYEPIMHVLLVARKARRPPLRLGSKSFRGCSNITDARRRMASRGAMAQLRPQLGCVCMYLEAMVHWWEWRHAHRHLVEVGGGGGEVASGVGCRPVDDVCVVPWALRAS